MRVIELFNKYFLFLMIVLSVNASIFEARALLHEGDKRGAKRARKIGIVTFCISIGLFTIRLFV